MNPLAVSPRERAEQFSYGISGEARRKAVSLISDRYARLRLQWQQQTKEMRRLEIENNRIFIDAYGLQDELSPEVPWNEITLTCNPWYRYGKVPAVSAENEEMPQDPVLEARLEKDTVKELISYAVGCMMGRYSLDTPGLAFAGGEWDDAKYACFLPDADAILPITDEEYFADDIVGRFCVWLKTVYGEEHQEENLSFIANALGNKGKSPLEVIRNYFLNDFYADHCQTYKKRPIYWLFDSGKASGFKALIYLHRYTPDTIGTLRIDYLHRMQKIYEQEIIRMQDVIDNPATPREGVAATKRKDKLTKQLQEARSYDEMIAHLALARINLDLDDGVKVNYEKLQTATDGKKYPVLAKI